MKQNSKHNDAVTVQKEIENKQQNKKALKIFIPVILAAAALGFVLGIGIIILQTQGDVGISGAMNFFHSLALFGAPWAVIIVTAAGLLATGLHISSARKLYKSADESAVDGEMDEGHFAPAVPLHVAVIGSRTPGGQAVFRKQVFHGIPSFFLHYTGAKMGSQRIPPRRLQIPKM